MDISHLLLQISLLDIPSRLQAIVLDIRSRLKVSTLDISRLKLLASLLDISRRLQVSIRDISCRLQINRPLRTQARVKHLESPAAMALTLRTTTPRTPKVTGDNGVFFLKIKLCNPKRVSDFMD